LIERHGRYEITERGRQWARAVGVLKQIFAVGAGGNDRLWGMAQPPRMLHPYDVNLYAGLSIGNLVMDTAMMLTAPHTP